MQRDLYQALCQWKQRKSRKPLILKGSRQVGKTFLLKLFGQKEYRDVIYLNFEQDKRLANLFEGSLDTTRLLQEFQLISGITPTPETTLIILDEIQQCPAALTSLKYFCEEANTFHVIAAGSLLGVYLASAQGFPVGKVNFLDLYPMSFLEFLQATGKTHWREYLEQKCDIEPISTLMHEELLIALKYYFLVGGMPEAVQQYADSTNMQEVGLIQEDILKSYLHDFSKYAPPTDVIKILAIWDSLPAQLARENKKFLFSAVKHSARAREYETALQWLINANLAMKATAITAPRHPLNSYHDAASFKLHFMDTGLLAKLSRVNPAFLLEGNALFQEFKGALTENFVAQTLQQSLGEALHYWTSTGTAEVDFLVTCHQHIFPVEVKSGGTQHKKSLGIYTEKYHPPATIRTNPLNFAHAGLFHNVPLYAIGLLPNLITQCTTSSS